MLLCMLCQPHKIACSLRLQTERNIVVNSMVFLFCSSLSTFPPSVRQYIPSLLFCPVVRFIIYPFTFIMSRYEVHHRCLHYYSVPVIRFSTESNCMPNMAFIILNDDEGIDDEGQVRIDVNLLSQITNFRNVNMM